jgi:hypothetical protein
VCRVSKMQRYLWSDGKNPPVEWVGVRLVGFRGNFKRYAALGGTAQWGLRNGMVYGVGPPEDQEPIWAKRRGGTGRESGRSHV